MSNQHYDAIIIGAGISGISAAYHFQKQCPGKTYKILERRDQLGGTWDLFNYPGIRSDSDMYTFGFSFRPWNGEAAIAEKDKIIEYLEDTIKEYQIDQNIEYGVHIKKASWSSGIAQWSITTEGDQKYSCQHVFMCVGYYNYDQGYTPEFEGIEKFAGEVIHPQHWPENTDYTDKNVIIIGSGATAVTLLPSMVDKAAHVTMLQRSPTYMGAKPAIDPIANWLAKWFNRHFARWWFILTTMFIYTYSKKNPAGMKKTMIDGVKDLVGDKFDEKHYTPHYNPWDERVCLCPDGDFFAAIKSGKASIATDHIDHFTEKGIQLKSGDTLAADMIITATGLNMLFLGGIEIEVDGKIMKASEQFVYKGLMANNTPNLYVATGYTNASWTLKVDLTNKYACRLINYLDKHNYRYSMPIFPEGIESAPLLDLNSGYIKRGEGDFPKQGTERPWKLHQNYIFDNLSLRFSFLKDKSITFH